VPDVVEVRVLGHGPTQDDGLEAPFVYEFFDKRGPFHGADFDVHANFLEPVLDDRGGLDAQFVALVGEDSERKGLF
jgi:hypothetical protein